ncbi:pirin family protein [uncultured Methanobacterium sp.]|uniref:pirin family protein n=1 Tax=uncultured Methanobacterium sp. TaxID=176306 RepID=UPI002AA5FF7B|nr:pirin family protein [uncultured Methanobacterium sp.]
MSLKKVAEIVEPIYVMEGAGVRLRRTIATDYLDYLDPFLLFDHFGSDDPRDYLAGFPLHPHRGIETVTYMLSGNVNHKDSMGNSGTIGACDVQWMTSGSGILHEEMPQKPEEGKLEGFQLWVNLPAKLKMTHPRYQEVKASQIPEITLSEGVQVKVIAGELNGVKGPVTEIFADPEYLDVSLEAESSFEHKLPEGHTVFAYVFEGEGVFDEEGSLVSATNLVIFGEGESIKVHTENKTLRFLLISGKPLNEPIARYGPFVMNTTEEIEDALKDLQKGTFVK